MAVPRALASIKRFGPRYGRTNKYKFAASENLKKNLKCPYCCSKNVKREAIGIYFCKKCSSKFTGRAYNISLRKQLTVQEESKKELVTQSKKRSKREARKKFEKEEVMEENA